MVRVRTASTSVDEFGEFGARLEVPVERDPADARGGGYVSDADVVVASQAGRGRKHTGDQ
jgi:hypothetical protein